MINLYKTTDESGVEYEFKDALVIHALTIAQNPSPETYDEVSEIYQGLYNFIEHTNGSVRNSLAVLRKLRETGASPRSVRRMKRYTVSLLNRKKKLVSTLESLGEIQENMLERMASAQE